MNPFDFVKDASFDKKNLMRDTENDELAEQSYVPWLVNKAFSYFADTILHANEMNVASHINNRAQYEYYVAALRKKKRFSKWVKEKENADIDAICKLYKCNKSLAIKYRSLMSDVQMETIRKRLDEGG